MVLGERPLSPPPTHNPIVIGVLPSIFIFFFLRLSQAIIAAVFLSNCCLVNIRKVYLEIISVPNLLLCFVIRSYKICKTNTAIYASVLPPPVWNQIRSIISLSNESSLVTDSITNKIKASWKGLHFNVIWLLELICVEEYFSLWIFITSFIILNVLNTSSLLLIISIPFLILVILFFISLNIFFWILFFVLWFFAQLS